MAAARTGPHRRRRRVEVGGDARRAADLDGAGYGSAFTVAVPPPAASPNGPTAPEQWARAVFEDAPRTLRLPILLGWRAVLRLRLDLDASPDRVLGWTIVTRGPDAVVLQARSPLLTARKVVQVDDVRLTATTFVRFERRSGRWIWAVVAPVHHRTEPLLLTLAARRVAHS